MNGSTPVQSSGGDFSKEFHEIIDVLGRFRLRAEAAPSWFSG
jgi:hypothetical protein